MRKLVAVTWLFAAMPGAGLALLLLVAADTWRGHFFAVVALALLCLPFVWISRARRSRKVIATAAVAALMAVLGISAPRVPDFAGQDGLSQLNGGSRLSLFAWLPEADQLVLGSWPLMLLDRALDAPHAQRLRTLAPTVFGDLRLIGSSIGDTVDDRSGQTFVFVPPHEKDERLPLLVFLHGSGGSLLAYQALLRDWAIAGHFAVVSPAFGIGNWQDEGGLETIEAARKFAESKLPIDPARVAIAGLSNGGRGLTRLIARDSSRRWTAIIALSAVIEADLLTAEWKDRDVLLIHGEADERISFAYFEEFAGELERHGAHVERRSWHDEDHFLWFSRPQELRDVVVPWLAARW
jgi:predicted esterase